MSKRGTSEIILVLLDLLTHQRSLPESASAGARSQWEGPLAAVFEALSGVFEALGGSFEALVGFHKRCLVGGSETVAQARVALPEIVPVLVGSLAHHRDWASRVSV